MTVVKIALEGERPLSWNAYYAGLHWRERKDEATRVHILVDVECRELDELPELAYPVHLLCLVYFKSNPQDCSNITTKLYEDGLVRAGLLKNDSPSYVASCTAFSLISKKHPRVELYVYDSSACSDFVRHFSLLVQERAGIAAG